MTKSLEISVALFAFIGLLGLYAIGGTVLLIIYLKEVLFKRRRR